MLGSSHEHKHEATHAVAHLSLQAHDHDAGHAHELRHRPADLADRRTAERLLLTGGKSMPTFRP